MAPLCAGQTSPHRSARHHWLDRVEADQPADLFHIVVRVPQVRAPAGRGDAQRGTVFHDLGPDGREWPLGDLMGRLAEVPGIARLRYTTSHPRDMTEDLVRAHGQVPELMPFLHLPVQSGSDRVLKAMNRKHTAGHYIRLVERLRAQPGVFGARLTGAGFGGACVALCRAGATRAAGEAALARYSGRGRLLVA